MAPDIRVRTAMHTKDNILHKLHTIVFQSAHCMYRSTVIMSQSHIRIVIPIRIKVIGYWVRLIPHEKLIHHCLWDAEAATPLASCESGSATDLCLKAWARPYG